MGEKRLCIVSTKDIMKANYTNNHGLHYVPCHGLVNILQRGAKEDSTFLPALILEDHDSFFKEFVTGHPLAKGKRDGVPLYVSDDAKIEYCTLNKASEKIESMDGYEMEFYRLYASGYNAINDHYKYFISKQHEEYLKKIKIKSHND